MATEKECMGDMGRYREITEKECMAASGGGAGMLMRSDDASALRRH